MSTTAYEHILQELEQLTPDERRRLRQALDEEPPGARFVSSDQLRQILAQPQRPLTERERAAVEAWIRRGDELAARIGAAWKDDMNAVEAVREL